MTTITTSYEWLGNKIKVHYTERAASDVRALEADDSSRLRLPRLAWALLRRWLYLMHGMWNGECAFTAYDVHDYIILAASVTGSISTGEITIHRVFWIEAGAKRWKRSVGAGSDSI